MGASAASLRARAALRKSCSANGTRKSSQAGSCRRICAPRGSRFANSARMRLPTAGQKTAPSRPTSLACASIRLIESFGSRAAESIRKNEIVAWLAEQAKARKWAPASRNRWQATFSLVFRVGIDNEKIARNPAARIRRKTEGNGRVRFLSDTEEKRLRAAIEGRFPKFLPHFLLSIHTGMRMGEQYGLRWNQVDFERRQLHLLRTKNGDPRTIPLNAVALAALQQMRGEKNRPGAEPVFPSVRAGDSLQGSRSWFLTALEEAKIHEYTWHCNRHTFASRLVMAGVDLRTVAELLGHRTLQMVMRYAHLAPEHQASAVDRLVPAEGRTVTKSATGNHRSENARTKPNINSFKINEL